MTSKLLWRRRQEVILLSITVLPLLHIVSGDSLDRDCSGLVCENGGTLINDNGDCRCSCPQDTSGLLCHYNLKQSHFPKGPHALPISKEGCPEGPARGWEEGYINITTSLPLDQTGSYPSSCRGFVDSWLSILNTNKTRPETNILGPYGRYSLQMNFCSKLNTQASFDKDVKWPKGNYGVYGVTDGCPYGFSTLNVSVCLPPLLLYNMDGTIPSVSIEETGGYTELKFTYCRRLNDDVEGTDTDWESFNPFLLLKDPDNETKGCPQSDKYDITSENVPVPLPARVMTDGAPDSQHFQLSFCYVVSKQYGFASDLKNDNFLSLWDKETRVPTPASSPGKQHVWIDGRLESKLCGNFTIGPPITNCKREETWVLIDAQKNVLVSAVVFDLAILSMGSFGEITHMFVGKQRWSFISHGALQCRFRQYVQWWQHFTFRCYRSLYGRYITMVFRTSVLTSFERMRFSNTVVSILSYNIDKVRIAPDAPDIRREITAVLEFTDVATENCGQEIGMQDFGIWDGQLTASSWSRQHSPTEARPQYSGWCADKTDLSPYVQVDLRFLTIIDGIVLYNWEELVKHSENNVYNKTAIPRGSASFRIVFGTTLDKLWLYGHREFVYDISQELSEPQTFQFITTFLARYIRILPTAFPGHGTACLRFEILGCRKYASIDCETSNAREIVNASSLFVPRENKPLNYTPVPESNSRCQEICFNDQSNCLATSYQPKMACTMYFGDHKKNYIEVAPTFIGNENQTMAMSAVVCLPDVNLTEYMMEYTMPQYDILQTWFDRTDYFVNTTGVLTSPWYPLMYSYSSVYRWTIHLPDISYILQFTDISLRKFQDYESNVFMKCRDTVILSALDESLLRNPYYNVYKSMHGENYEFFQLNLDSDYNGRTPSFPRMQKSFNVLLADITSDDFYIEFIVCSTGNVIENGRGFRLHIIETETPICQANGKQSNCLLPEMEIRTPSFNGLYSDRHSLVWEIVVGALYVYQTYADFDSLVMTIHLEDFDISCHSESVFQIYGENVDGVLSYCNTNKPFGLQYFISGPKSIEYRKYQHQLLSGQLFREGFRLSYKYIPRNETLPEEMSLVEESGDGGSSHTKRVCSEKFKKCYTLYLMQHFSWDRAAEFCEESNSLLVNTKIVSELEFVRSVITAYHRELRLFPMLERSTDFFIGLRRYVDSDGIMHEHWTDGTPLTFTAWKRGLTKDTLINKCTKMHIQQPNNMKYWNTTSCSQQSKVHEMVACESIGTARQSPKSLGDNFVSNFWSYLPDMNSTLPKSPSTLFECSSGEWVSQVARCDGISECRDSSDERSCSVLETGCGDEGFMCTNGLCIHVSKVCDFKIDCFDKSDEYCVFESCGSNEFTCTNGQCISADDRCDSERHCSDNSDEFNCDQCNTNRAFQCGDTSCISKRLVCDKHVDCKDGADERSCDRKYITCDDLWTDGFTDSGYFVLDEGYTIHCNFDDVKDPEKENVLRMTYMNHDWKQVTETDYVVETSGMEAAQYLNYNCFQKFTELPHRERIRVMEIDNITIHLEETVTSTDPVSDIYIQSPTGTYTVEKLRKDDAIIRAFNVTVHDTFNFLEHTIAVGNTECVKRNRAPIPLIHRIQSAHSDEEETIACNEGVKSVSQTERCLLKKDISGRITGGCRSLTHLQNCENFTCPENYFKCPGSYCISAMLVCDGRVDCKEGEDESVCGCDVSTKRNIVILIPDFDSRFHQRLYSIASNLAGSLYTGGSTIKVLRVKRKNELEGHIYFVGNKVYSNGGHVTSVLRNYGYSSEETLEYALFGTPEDEVRGIVWLSDEVTINEVEESIFSADMSVGFHVYRLVIDETARREIDIKNKSERTEIIIRNFNVLQTLGASFVPKLCNGTYQPCVGQYRCRLSKVCIPFSEVCDTRIHCPYGDDEEHCDFHCQGGCICKTLISICTNLDSNELFNLSRFTRMLDLSNSTYFGKEILKRREIRQNLPYLVSLNISMCNISEINSDSFRFLDNLLTLDISFNTFEQIGTNSFESLKYLQHLYLHENYFLHVIQPGAFNGLVIRSIIISNADINNLYANTFAGLNLTILDLSNNNIKWIKDAAFNSLYAKRLNIQENPIKEFSKEMFLGTEGLEHLQTSAYKFCCIRPSYLPEQNCFPRRDEFSSCKDLMRDVILQALLWIIGILAFIGNIISVIYRLLYDKKRMKLGYGIFVTNLAMSDLLMGLYMLMIAIADRVFRDRYIEMDEYWRNSSWCKLAGILSTVSSEASVMFMCLITIDRILVIKYPFGQVRFKVRNANAAAVFCWAFVVAVAVFPALYADYFEDRFYSRSAVCLALPLTRDRPAGWLYSIVIFIALNFTTFVLIAVGQWLIYMEIKKQASVMKSMNVSRTNDLKVARNLLLVVTTDFLCWFPIGLMGIMALSGQTIPGDVYAWTAVLVLPVNSAINPFLYTLTAIIGKQKFNPNIEEQGRIDLFKEVGNSILRILSYVSRKKRSKPLDVAMKRHKMSVKSATRIIYQVTKFVELLHQHDITVGYVAEKDLYVTVTKQGYIGEIEHIELPTGIARSSREKKHADDLYQAGLLLDKILGKIEV